MTRVADARDRYVADFEAFAGNGGGGDAPSWLRALREQAIVRFAELGFPSTRQEEWRFTNVAPLTQRAFALSNGSATPGVPVGAVTPLCVAGRDAVRLVFVNGAFASGLSAVATLPQGLRVSSLRAALQADSEPALRHLGRHAQADASPFTALNTAFQSDGAFMHVAPGAQLDRPIELVFVATGHGEPAVCHPRTLVVVGRGARAAVLESYVALHDGVYWTNTVSEAVLEDGARLEYYRLQRESLDGYHTATTHAALGRDSVLRFHPLALGGVLTRHDIQVVLGGTGGELVLNGLYLLGDRQHADHHTVIDHAQPDCASHEYFNGLVADEAHGVFNGRIIVRPGAQRTDSKQTNNNLLLSTAARADSQPQLEIYADYVKCTHGSTVGPLDEAALHYLRSRGLGAEAAAGLLTYGFAAEILGRMDHAPLRGALDELIMARLAHRSAGGRKAA